MSQSKFKEFIDAALADGSLENQLGEREHTTLINFYLNYKAHPIQTIETLFQNLGAEIAQHEVVEAAKNNRRCNKRSAVAQEKFHACIKAIVLNAVHVRQLAIKGLHIGIPLDRNFYGTDKRYAPNFISSRQIEAVFHGLCALGYIKIHRKGYRDPASGRGERTRFYGTPKLFDAFDCATNEQPVKLFSDHTRCEEEIIILRDKDKRPADYEETTDTRKARNNLQLINNLITRHAVTLDITKAQNLDLEQVLMQKRDDAQILKRSDESNSFQPFIDYTSVRLSRIFSDGSFNKGGRFYRGWWQNVPKAYRPHIMIDGKPTIELDYSALHPTMLYAEQGLPMCFEDPYFIDPRVHRRHGKTAFNALLNAAQLPENVPKGFPSLELDWKEFLGLMRKHHAPVDVFFLKGYGLKLQFDDSKLAEAILLYFTQKDIPCLPIHDSFIVNSEHEKELDEVMRGMFLDFFGEPIQVKKVMA